MADPLVVLEGVTKSFGTDVVTQVLHGIDLEIQPAEFTALAGPSGSGKSTLLNLLGLLDRPTSGRILLSGLDTGGLTDDERSAVRGRSLGFVFQFHHLLPEFTALENVMMPGIIRGTSRSTLEARAKELLDRVNLGHRISHRPSEMSGGEQQRVALARALSMRPKMLLADEPTGNLDSATGSSILDVLVHLRSESGTTLVLVTHDPAVAALAGRRIHLRDGRIERDETST